MSNEVKREIFFEERLSLGIIGESVSNSHYKVGDVITFRVYGETYVRPIVKLKDDTKGGIMGFGANHLKFDNVQRLLSHEDLTEDILRKLQEVERGRDSWREGFTIREIEIEEMTLSEIERELGRRIKVVAE